VIRRLVAIALLASTAGAGEAPRMAGLWIQHDAWKYWPQEDDEDGDVHKSATAAVMNFCADGAFGLATGVIYQSKKSPSVQIGASDGLAIYRGTWTTSAGRVSVNYRLVDAEFADLMTDPVASAPHSAEFAVAAEKIAFPFTNVGGKKFVLTFTNAARYGKQVLDEWVGCEPRKPPPPPPAPRRSGGDRGNRPQSRRRSSVTSPNDSR
jgi:hypothetical protein